MNASDIPGNRFAMVNVAIQRSRQLIAGAPPRVPVRADENMVSVVIREMRSGSLPIPDAAKSGAARREKGAA